VGRGSCDLSSEIVADVQVSVSTLINDRIGFHVSQLFGAFVLSNKSGGEDAAY